MEREKGGVELAGHRLEETHLNLESRPPQGFDAPAPNERIGVGHGRNHPTESGLHNRRPAGRNLTLVDTGL
jgi:hypothetical protein